MDKMRVILGITTCLLTATQLEANQPSCFGCNCCYDYAVNPPLIEPGCCRLFGGVEFLYWKPYEDDLHFTTTTQGKELETARRIDDVVAIGKGREVSFEWESGFRVSLGYHLPCDSWSLQLNWAHLNSQVTDHIENQKQIEGENVNFTWVYAAPPFLDAQPWELNICGANDSNSINGLWKLSYDQVNLFASRSFLAGCSLILEPHAGLTYLSILQKMRVEIDSTGLSYDDPDFQVNMRTTSDLVCDFKGVGIVTGLNSIWNFCCGLGIYANADVGIVYGEFDRQHHFITYSISDVDNTNFNHTLSNGDGSLTALRAEISSALGLCYISHFNCDRSLFRFKAGWEQKVFFGQNMFPVISNIFNHLDDDWVITNTRGHNTNLYLYGFVFGVECSF